MGIDENTRVAPAPQRKAGADVELSVVMPCLNEAETLGTCIAKANRFFRESGVKGEVVIADNGSTDGSQAIAESLGARIVDVPIRGYGAALIAGIQAAKGRYVAMGDSDDSYDFLGLMPFVERLRAGADLVMGNRFMGGIAKGAMPPLHRYLGNPVLSFAGRILYNAPIGDFHCGLRAFRRDSILNLDLRTTGMEFASEMVVRAQLAGLKLDEVPTTLSPDGRSRPPHLRSWRDGWRHLKFLLTFAPNGLFLYPGAALSLIGLIALGFLLPGNVMIGEVGFGVHTLLFSSAAVVMGTQMMGFGYLARIIGARDGLWPLSPGLKRVQSWFGIDRACIYGGLVLASGLGLAFAAFAGWMGGGYGQMSAEHLMRVAIPAVLLCDLGLQVVFTGFMAALLSER
jgi:glycosyltransferase involved in cell wall biosynthesis